MVVNLKINRPICKRVNNINHKFTIILIIKCCISQSIFYHDITNIHNQHKSKTRNYEHQAKTIKLSNILTFALVFAITDC